MNTYCLFNGEIKRTSEPVFKVQDLGLLRGYGVFDFFPIRQSRPVFFDQYWNRFRNSAIQMRLPFQWEQASFAEQLDELIRKNELEDGYCRLLLTGGYSSNGFYPDGIPNFLVITQGPIHYPPSHYEKGIKLLSLEYVREYPQIKSINYMTVLLARDLLREKSAEDVLYYSPDSVTESSRSNFFIIGQDHVLRTPGRDILPGITRAKVLEAAEKIMPVEITDISLKAVRQARSAFITSTTKGIMPVTHLDDYSINEGMIEPVISTLQEALRVEMDKDGRRGSK